MQVKIANATLSLLQGDITQQSTQAIVNAANTSLLGGGGVDGAIDRAGGPAILEECKKIGGCKTGDAVITTGGNLKARYVIHTVGPVWRGGESGEPELLKNAYANSLKIARENGTTSVAFPSISTGAYRYPLEKAAEIALSAAIEFLKKNPEIERVHFVLFDTTTYKAYEKILSNALNLHL